jgi:hypothetical protein
MTEALGGWFVFGLRNALRDWLARTLRIWGVEDKVRSQQTHDKMKAHFESLGADLTFSFMAARTPPPFCTFFPRSARKSNY